MGLLQSENVWVRRFAAQLLLPFLEKEALETLSLISLSEGFASLQAQAVITSWKNKNE